MAHRRHVIATPKCAAPTSRRAFWLVRGTLLALVFVAGATLIPASHAQLPQMKPSFSAAYQGADPMRGYHTGRVLRLEDGSPVADAHVGATWIEYKSWIPYSPQFCVHAAYTRTDANGFFKFRLYKGERPFNIVAMKGMLSIADPPFNIGELEPGKFYVVRSFATYEEQQAAKGKYERLHGPLKSREAALHASGQENLYLWDNRLRKPGSGTGLPNYGALICWPNPPSEVSLLPFYEAYSSQLQVLLAEAASAPNPEKTRPVLDILAKELDERLERLRNRTTK